ncbi:MAG: VWA domain-containing protein, partial [Planctomycetales bacterium]
EGRGTGVAEFFGITASGNAFVFVVDISGSMRGGRFTRAKAELRRSIDALNEKQSYYIIFYNHRTLPMPSGGLLAATTQNLVKTTRWMTRYARCTGDTYPEPALKMALRIRPDAVFLLSDGEFDRFVAVRISEYQTGFPVPIHTVGFTNRDGEAVLKAIAERTGGTYRFVR